ncbi:MAG: response regulator [Steroidobacteraceae bacterium]|jgi:DNA-binding response OmpR family regulator
MPTDTLGTDIAQATAPEAPSGRSRGEAETRREIMVYEEDHLTRALMREWLNEAGYRVRTGLLCAASPTPRVDLVIVSLYMPKLAGANCVGMIRAAHPGTPVIAISGQFRPGLAAAGAIAQTLGAQKVIAKPLVRHELLEAVRAMIGTAH